MGSKKKILLCGLTFMFVLLQKIIYCLKENLMSISINQTAAIYDKRQQGLVKTCKLKTKISIKFLWSYLRG